MACSRRPEQTANNSAPVVQISKNNAEAGESTTAQATTAAQEKQQVIQHVMQII